MAKSDLYDLLDIQITRLQTGKPVEEILEPRPQLEPELEQALLTAALLLDYSRTPPPVSASINTLNTVLSHGARLRETAAKRQRTTWSFPILAFRFAVALVFLGILFSGVTIQAQGALPGDLLYPWKRGSEDLRVALALSEDTQRSLKSAFDQRRNEEVRAVIAINRSIQVKFSGRVLFQSETQWQVEELLVQITPTTIYDNQLQIGDLVYVTGATQAGGTIRADVIQPYIDPEKTAEPTKTITVPAASPSPTSTGTQPPLPTAVDSGLIPPETQEGGDKEGEAETENTPTAAPNTPTPKATITPSSTLKPTNTPVPSPTQTPTKTPKVDDEETEEPEPSNSPEPSETPKRTETEEPDNTPEPTKTQEPTETEEPDDTPKPSETEDPTETPKPTETSEND